MLAGCGENIDHRKIRSSGFVYCGESAPTTFNPQLADNDITSDALGPQIYNTLLTIDPETHLPIASLASSWMVNSNGLEYVFKLRPMWRFKPLLGLAQHVHLMPMMWCSVFDALLTQPTLTTK